MFKWLFSSTTPAPQVEPPASKPHWATHFEGKAGFGGEMLERFRQVVVNSLPQKQFNGTAMDDSSNGMPAFKSGWGQGTLPDNLVAWYASQSFMGHALAAIVAQHWLIDKVCTMPARDAIRHGYDIHVFGMSEADPTAAQEDSEEAKLVKQIRELDKKYRVRKNMEEFIRFGRVFGVRILFFKVESNDPGYYEKPFNIDGITPNSFKGIVQVDPYWCIPMMDGPDASDPASEHFYEPTWWTINGKKYHRSHLCIFRNSPPADILKPMYQYGGIPVPQKILERVYAAERTANEAPQLAMTKRSLVWSTDVAKLLTNQTKFAEHMSNWVTARDNYGVKLVDDGDTMTQLDTALADLDVTIMTQYQLVASGGNVPAVKLLGTTPKGFNSTGEYEEASYHEELEAIQANDLTDLLDRYHAILLRSEIEPGRSLLAGTLSLSIDWNPVDSPTAKEYAEINKIKAETDNALVTAGAIDGMDIRNRIKKDPNSEYTGLADVAEGELTDAPTDPAATIEDPADVGAAAERGDIPGETPKPAGGV